ncbi:MAG: Glyoxalase/bleomycin resistance protein/dioxygenase [Bryobacterales bacterium]|nr:Glyoxalase/bleomycin resistance protein/dioxygenase [Bryobacterales bacterium]
MGHIHLVVADPAAYQKTIVSVLGGTPVNAGPLTMVKLPGVFFIMTAAKQGAGPSGGSKGSTADHMGFSVKSFAALKAKAVAAGLNVQEVTPNVQAFVTFPNDVIVEVQEDTSLTTDSAFSHYHLAVPDQNAAREWYMKTFGGVEAQRRPGLKGVGIPPGTVDFLGGGGGFGKGKAKEGAPPAAPPAPPAATKGRYLDHIGFEVKDLDAFAKKLEADGVKFDMAPRDMTKQFGLKIAFITDPFGTYIELTEGLSKQ